MYTYIKRYRGLYTFQGNSSVLSENYTFEV